MTTYFLPRGSLARALFERQKNDNYIINYDKRQNPFQWYKCNLDLVSADLASRFIKLSLDEETCHFLNQSEEKSGYLFMQLWHSVAKVLLGWFMTQTSVNGWLQRGSMFVLSYQQFLLLMSIEKDSKLNSLLDLGAGDGEVTAKLAPVFQEVFVTEVSDIMKKLLAKRKFKVLKIEDWHKDRQYDVISCLNLLDRCDKPLTLLRNVKKALAPDGRLVIAVVLPFYAYVETGSSDHKPSEKLLIKGKTFEEQVSSIVQEVFTPLGFEVLNWTRVPYLCEGDLQQSYYWLDDAVFVLKNSQEE